MRAAERSRIRDCDSKGSIMADLQEQLGQYGIDYADAMDRFDGNMALYKRLALKYESDDYFVGLRAAMEVKDYDAAYKYAHSLKGVAGNLSFRKLYDQVAIVSDALKQGEMFAAQEHMPLLEEANEKVIEGLAFLESAEV